LAVPQPKSKTELGSEAMSQQASFLISVSANGEVSIESPPGLLRAPVIVIERAVVKGVRHRIRRNRVQKYEAA
jgi:hypothetical protein